MDDEGEVGGNFLLPYDYVMAKAWVIQAGGGSIEVTAEAWFEEGEMDPTFGAGVGSEMAGDAPTRLKIWGKNSENARTGIGEKRRRARWGVPAATQGLVFSSLCL